MECNKDEAKRAMDIAEKKLTEKDYTEAKKFANKAQNLFPDLDGLKQLLMIIEVYIGGEKRDCGETDWYGILGVDPLADDEAVRKQYRKLALMLHPDKNKCVGAEGAFKLISEAWSLLSDQVKRFSYNVRRQVRDTLVRFPRTQRENPSHQPTSNGFQNVRPPVVSSSRARTKPAPRMDSPAFVSSIPKDNTTFWTLCKECMTQYEYPRVYLNQTLLCPNCRVGFVAKEEVPPKSVEKLVNLSSNQHHWSSKNQAKNKNSCGTSSGRGNTPSVSHRIRRDNAAPNSRNATNQATNVVQEAQVKLKRGFEESQEREAARGFTNFDQRNLKKPRTDDSHMFGASRFCGPSDTGKGNTETRNTAGPRNTGIQGRLLPRDVTKAVMNKSQQDIFERLPKMIAKMVEDLEKEKKSMKKVSKENEVKRNDKVVEKDNEVITIVVPDSDFHNFDLDRSENSFKDDQVWAAYGDDDGMPRFYARIQKVISLNPFRMRISWLNSKSCSEFGPIDWIGSGFAKTCGDFRAGRYESTDTLNAFSHKVDFTKGERGIFHIVPKKGQVWALYRNWSPDWDKNSTPDEVIHKYDMVEVLDDYTEEKQSVTVAVLIKAEGFKAVFRRSTVQEDVRNITKEEMFKFSHQVPHYILTGEEADNAPKGCLELDPAATPCELLSEKAEMENEKSSVPNEDEGFKASK